MYPAGGLNRRTCDSLLQRNAHFQDGGSQAVHQVGYGARNVSVLLQAAVRTGLDRPLSAEIVLPIRHAGAAQAVADQKDVLIAHEPEGGAHGGRVNVDAVTDELTGDVAARIAPDLIHGRTDRARVAMPEIAHGIVQMDQMAGTGLECPPCRVVITIRMRQGYRDIIPNRMNVAFKVRIDLRSQPDDLQQAPGGIQEVLGHLDIAGKNVIGILRSLLAITDERPLHVETDEICTGAGVPGCCGIVCAKSQNVCQDGGRECERRGADGGYSVLCLIGSNPPEALGTGVTHIESEGAMKMDVDQPGNDVAAGGIHNEIVAQGIFRIRRKEAVGNADVRLTKF